ncbi:type II secretion system F family protein [Candidatus Sumerlaeota bacterium]|nr:type II secretion system F family protein [Candidatus Sumerlaeota bacterium]
MPEFQYKALNSDSALSEGRVTAAGRQEAFHKLETMGLNPIRLEENSAKVELQTSRFAFEWRPKKVSSRDLERFTRQLSSLLAAGVSLSRALHIIQRESASRAARDKWKEIYELVIDGSSLADAMRRSPGAFPGVYIAMVQAGETGGFLDLVLGQIADFQAREKDLKSRTISALIYPLVLMTLALSALVFLLVFFIPRFQKIFEGFGASLPLITRLIVSASGILIHYGPYVLILGGVGVLIIRKWFQSETGRRAWQRWLLKTPVAGPLVARFAMTRFCRMLGALVGAGVPLINALRVARESIGNQTLIDAVTNSIERIREGDSLAASLSGCKELFPGSVIEMIAVAEESGRLERELIRIASETEQDLDRRLRTAVSLTEPVMLFVMAGFIGTIFVGMVIPIFTIQDYIK